MFLFRHRPVLAALFICLFFTKVFPDCASGLEKDGRIMRGSSKMPVPALLPLDYYVERARAWLKALKQASSFLPAQALGRLWDMDCDTALGRLALASLLFPIETATPDISYSRNIEVFLSEVDDPLARSAQVLEMPELFLLQLSLINDMGNILKKIHSFHLKDGKYSQEQLTGLDPLAYGLEEIWNISRALQKGKSVDEALKLGISGKGELLIAMIKACEKRLEAHENQAALTIAEDALLHLERDESDDWPGILKKYFQGMLLRLRGLAHWRQSQLALAEKDLSRAIGLLNETALPLYLRGESYVDLGALRQARRDIEGMCSAYRDACAFGLCAPLANSRRQGLCLENQQL